MSVAEGTAVLVPPSKSTKSTPGVKPDVPVADTIAGESDTSELRRRLIVRLSTILAIATLAGLVLRELVAPIELVSVFLTAAFGVGFIVVSWLARRSRSAEVAGALLILLTLGLVSSVGYVAGGLNAPLLALLPIVPAVAVAVLGAARGWIAAAAVALVTLTFVYLHSAGHPLAQRTTPENFRLARALMLVIASVLVTAIVVAYDRQNRRLRRELENQATRDPLTGLPNRRQSASALAYAWARATRDGGPVSVVLFDLDYFKKYNDSLGHQAGDECLRSVADVSRTVIRRATDLVARHGGEEFLAILPATDHEAALHVAEELRSTLEQRRIYHPAAPAGVVTASFGVATAVDAGKMTSEELFQQADEALYRAKAGGRNTVEGWRQETDSVHPMGS